MMKIKTACSAVPLAVRSHEVRRYLNSCSPRVPARPDPDCLVCTAAGKGQATRHELHASHVVGVPHELNGAPPRPAGVAVPQEYVPAGVARAKEVRAVPYGPRCGELVSHEPRRLLQAHVKVPDKDVGAIARCQHPSCGVKVEVCDSQVVHAEPPDTGGAARRAKDSPEEPHGPGLQLLHVRHWHQHLQSSPQDLQRHVRVRVLQLAAFVEQIPDQNFLLLSNRNGLELNGLCGGRLSGLAGFKSRRRLLICPVGLRGGSHGHHAGNHRT
eukprot:scaffold108864_cov42-Prasinocladus_malaysianus.AAC.2